MPEYDIELEQHEIRRRSIRVRAETSGDALTLAMRQMESIAFNEPVETITHRVKCLSPVMDQQDEEG